MLSTQELLNIVWTEAIEFNGMPIAPGSARGATISYFDPKIDDRIGDPARVPDRNCEVLADSEIEFTLDLREYLEADETDDDAGAQ